MSLLAVDGFDHYAFTDAQAKGWSLPFSAAMSPGRYEGGKGCNWTAYSAPAANKYPLLQASAAHVFVGFGWQFLATDAETPVLAFYDGATVQCQLTWDGSAGLFRLRAGNTMTGTPLAVSSALTVTAANWHHLFVDLTIGDSGGVTVTLDSTTPVFTATNIDTQASSNAQITHVALPIGGANVPMRYDDLYAMDTSGTVDNTAQGDLRIGTRVLTGDGTHLDMLPSSAGTHFDDINGSVMTTNSNVSADTVGQTDTYQVADVGALQILGIQVNVAALKSDAAARSIASVIRSAGTDYVGPNFPLSASVQFLKTLAQVDPATNAAWTGTGFNAIEVGQKVTV